MLLDAGETNSLLVAYHHAVFDINHQELKALMQ
jgi:hypothetical protein